MDAVAAAPMFAALGDATRLGIVVRLASEGPLSIARLSAGSGVTRQAITKHVVVLAEAGLVRGEGEGPSRGRRWELSPGRLEEASDYLEAVSRGWDAALERLRAFVEEG